MKYINHPLIGDYLYAGRKTSRNDREWAPRVMLHAWKIVLTQPTAGSALAIEAPIPDDMNRIINKQ
jgi:23S rRNA pseudouridine1911/1915/1917 synthase